MCGQEHGESVTMTTLLVTPSLFLHVGQGVAVLIPKVIFFSFVFPQR